MEQQIDSKIWITLLYIKEIYSEMFLCISAKAFRNFSDYVTEVYEFAYIIVGEKVICKPSFYACNR